MNEGEKALQCVNGSNATIAERLYTHPSRQLVGCWRAGKSLPTMQHRVDLEKWYGIPREAWDRQVGAKARAALNPTPKILEEPDPVAEPGIALRQAVDAINRKLAELEMDDVDPSKWASVANARTSALRALAKHEESLVIVRHKVETEVLELIGQVLDRHPDVAQEILDALP